MVSNKRGKMDGYAQSFKVRTKNIQWVINVRLVVSNKPVQDDSKFARS
jgi:hypothetical protein